MLDKKQAAEYLQVTTRSLERYTNEGRISVRYEQSPNGEIAMFDPEELKKFKTDKQTSRIKPTVEPDRPQYDRPSNPQSQIIHSSQPQTELHNLPQEVNFGLSRDSLMEATYIVRLLKLTVTSNYFAKQQQTPNRV